MSRRRKSLLLLASALALFPVSTSPAQAEWITAGCESRAFGDPTDPQGEIWFEITSSYFVGTVDVTQFAITCWYQTSKTYGTDEIANTRHTCSGIGNHGACANPVLFVVAPNRTVYECMHLVWVDQGNNTTNTGNVLTTGQFPSTGVLPSSTGQRRHTRSFDAERDTPGIQCETALTT